MSLRKNLVANYLGQGWTALMGLAFIPMYVRELGPEAFGMVGVFALLQAAVAFLDLGLTPTLTRELARLRAGAHSAETIRDLLRSLEVLYACLTTCVVAVVWFGAAWMADDWLRVNGLPRTVVVSAVRIMAFVLAARWMEQVYRGALQGLQDLVWLNKVQALLATLRWGGAWGVLVIVEPSVTTFFAWQGLVSIATVFLLVWRAYRLLPPATRAAGFSVIALRRIRGFAGGMFFGTLLGFLLMQADKLVISKMLPLEQLGYYTVATTAAAGLMQLTMPMNTALLPRLTEYAARSDDVGLSSLYLRSCEWMSAIIVAPALVMTFFAKPVLLVWTGDARLASEASGPLALLSLGMLLNGLMNLPYMLQLAHGWVRLSVQTNLVAVLVVVPMLIWVVPRYGGVGAAGVWLGLNVACCLAAVQLMHRRILPAVKLQWMTNIAWPILFGGLCAGVLRAGMPVPHSRAAAGYLVAGASITVLLAVWASLPAMRGAFKAVLRRACDRQPI